MNHYVDAFLKEVLGQIRYKKVHAYLAQELNDHIELFKEELIEEGLSEDEAYKRAVEAMGEPEKIGKGLHKLHKPKMEWGILLLLIGLIGMGLLAIGTYSTQVPAYGFLLEKQSLYVILGAIAFGITYFMNYRKLEKFSLSIYLMGMMIIILTLLFGIEVNGLRKWVAIGPFAINSSHIAMPLLMIGYVGCVKKWANRGWLGYIFLGGLAVSAIFICMMEQLVDGVYIAISLLGIFTFYIMGPTFKGNRRRMGLFLITSITAGIGGMAFFILSKEYRIKRLISWFWPEIDLYGAGYLPMNIREVLQGAGWFGNKEMLFTKTAEDVYVKIPDGTTDFVLTFIIGSMGWLIALVSVSIITICLIRCFKIARRTKDEYGKLILYGISIFFTIQYLLGIAINLAILPLGTGGLPFISYGGGKLLCDMALMGLFLGIYRRKDIIVYELLDSKKITKEEVNKVKRKSWLVRLAIDILRSSDEIDEIKVTFK